MKKTLTFAIVILLVASFGLNAEYDHPSQAPSGACYRLDVNPCNPLGFEGSWVKQTVICDGDGNPLWANYKCSSSGSGCGTGDWCTWWMAGSVQEPPLPDSDPWQSTYWGELFLPNYNPTTGVYS